MADETKTKPKIIDDEDKDNMISKLISEKKAIKEKNVRLASLLNVVTKKISDTDNSSPQQIDDSKLVDILDKMALLKKQMSSIEHMLEKSKIDSKVDELNKTLSAIDSRVEDIDIKLAAVHKIPDIENKLNEIESLIRLHKRTNETPFGMLGSVGNTGKLKTLSDDDNPDSPDTPDNSNPPPDPDNSNSPDTPDDSNSPPDPDNSNSPDTSDDSNSPPDPDNSNSPDTPDNSNPAPAPDNPDSSNSSDDSNPPPDPDNSNSPDTPDDSNPAPDPDNSNSPDTPDNSNPPPNPDNSENSNESHEKPVVGDKSDTVIKTDKSNEVAEMKGLGNIGSIDTQNKDPDKVKPVTDQVESHLNKPEQSGSEKNLIKSETKKIEPDNDKSKISKPKSFLASMFRKH